MHPRQGRSTLTMNSMTRVLKGLTEGIGEGKRWNGRTQSSESWSPEQLHRDLHLQVDKAPPVHVRGARSGPPSPAARTMRRSRVAT